MKLIRLTTVPQSLRTLLKGQLKFMTLNFDVIAISSDGDCFNDMLTEQNVMKSYRVKMTRKITPLEDLKALFLLVKIFCKERPEIVHTHTPKAGLLGMIAAWISRVPIRIHTVAGLPLLEAKGLKRVLLNLIERITYACAVRIYPNSINLKKIIIENKFTNTNKIKVIGEGSSNGIDLNYFSPHDKTFKKINVNEERGFTFCFVGRVVKDKGINELVEAFCQLYKEYTNIRLLIIGRFEDDLDPISIDVKNTIMDHRGIEYVGYQSDIRPFLFNSDVFVFPSYREGFPNVVMQAGAMGLPSIVSNINGCNEIIIAGINGEIIPVKDVNALYSKMKYMYEHPIYVKKLSANARKMIESRYDQSKVWQAILDEYNLLIREYNV